MILQESDERKEAFEVQGRGEMQLGVLIETMRREGFELSVSPPTVVYREDKDGTKTEPIEEVTIEVDEQYAGIVIEKVRSRMWPRRLLPFTALTLERGGFGLGGGLYPCSCRSGVATWSTWRRSWAARPSCSCSCRPAA